MLNNIKKILIGFIILLLFTNIFSIEDNFILRTDIEKEFDLVSYQKIDLLDYITIGSGVCNVYKNILKTNSHYYDMFMFSSMGKIIYNIYEKDNLWKIIKREYKYKEPYNTDNQIVIEINFLVNDNTVFYFSSSDQQEKAGVDDAKSIDRIVDLINKIQKDLE